MSSIRGRGGGVDISYSMDKKSSLQHLRIEEAQLKALMESGSVGIDDLFLRLEQRQTSPQPTDSRATAADLRAVISG